MFSEELFNDKYVKSFNEKYKHRLKPIYESINKKFNTDRAKIIVNTLILITEPYIYEDSQIKLLSCLLIRDLEIFCETRKVKDIEDFEPKIMLYTKLYCMEICGLPV